MNICNIDVSTPLFVAEGWPVALGLETSLSNELRLNQHLSCWLAAVAVAAAVGEVWDSSEPYVVGNDGSH